VTRFVVSYDRDDADFVKQLVSVMELDHHDIWYYREIDYGEPFSRVIKREIDRADEVIVLWSPASVESSWVENEAAYALSQEKIRPACINGLDVTDVPLGFFGLNTFIFEDDNPQYLKSAVRQFIRSRALGIGRDSAKANRARASKTQSGASSARALWLFAPAIAVSAALGGVLTDRFGISATALRSSEDHFLEQYGLIEQEYGSDHDFIRWTRYTHGLMFPHSDELNKFRERREGLEKALANKEEKNPRNLERNDELEKTESTSGEDE